MGAGGDRLLGSLSSGEWALGQEGREGSDQNGIRKGPRLEKRGTVPQALLGNAASSKVVTRACSAEEVNG